MLDFEYEDESNYNKYIHDVRLFDVVSNKVFYDKLRLLYIEMPRFKKKLDELKTNEDKWLYFLKNLPYMDEIPTELNGEIFKTHLPRKSFIFHSYRSKVALFLGSEKLRTAPPPSCTFYKLSGLEASP